GGGSMPARARGRATTCDRRLRDADDGFDQHQRSGHHDRREGCCAGPGEPLAHLINLFSAVALLVWGTSLVRTGVLALGGANMRAILAKSLTNRLAAAAAGIGVT